MTPFMLYYVYTKEEEMLQMQNSNELFKTFILNNLSMTRRGIIPEEFAQQSIAGYYKALADLGGTDELTTLYKDLAGYVYGGTPNQQKNAKDLLEGTLDLSTVLDVLGR